MAGRPPPYPLAVCRKCGETHGRKKPGDAMGWRFGICDICGRGGSVTGPVSFGHLAPSWAETAMGGDDG